MELEGDEMRILRSVGLLAALTLLAAWPSASQMMGNMPNLRGVWNPVIGSGASYQVDGKTGKTELEIAVVGKEDVSGKPGFWVEMGMSPNGTGQMYIKNLMVLDGKNTGISRMIMQMPGQTPMEMPTAMFNRNPAAAPTTDIRDQAEHVGTEDVTTPAGTFSCEHYRSAKDAGDVWISAKVTPWGLVKAVNNGQTIVVDRLISDAKDHITGTPKQFDPAEMMRQRGGQPPQQ
jgi:hypothetical protein